MRILISLRRHDAMQKARDWFGNNSTYPVLKAITEWAKRKQPDWGECVIIVEAEMPGSRNMHARNIDFLIAFSTRVAVIEVKNHRRLTSAQASLAETLKQCCLSFDLVSAHLAGVVPEKAIRPFIFIPELESNEIAQLTTDQLSKHSLTHPTITGGSGCAEKPALPNGHPLFLAHALDLRLGAITDFDHKRFGGNANAAISKLIAPVDVHEFSSLDLAVEAIQHHSQAPSPTSLPEHYVHNLRGAELDQFSEHLNTKRIVEIRGAPGIGKSDFTREALQLQVETSRKDMLLAIVSVRDGHTLSSLARELLICFGQQPDDAEDERTLLERLLRTDGVVWFPRYDTSAQPVIARLIDVFLGRPDRVCRLIIESHESRISATLPQSHVIDLGTLSTVSTLEILKRITPARSDRRLPDVLAKARGNPHLALAHWRSADAEPVPDWLEGNYLWLERMFADPVDRAICYLVVVLVDDCLLPVTLDLLNKAACSIFPGVLKSRIRRTIARTVACLEASSTIDLRWFNVEDYRVLALLPEDARVKTALICGVDVTLAKYVCGRIEKSQLQDWNEHFVRSLSSTPETARNSKILLALKQNELTPWFASPFRGPGPNKLDDVIGWLDRRITARAASLKSPGELYLERALRFARAAMEDKTLQIAEELGEPPAGFRWATYVHKLLTTVTTSSGPFLVDSSSDGDDRDSAIEAACWKVMFSPRRDWQDMWLTLEHVASTSDRLPPAVRLQVYHYALMCATFCGQGFIDQTAGVRDSVVSICKELARLAVTENLLYLRSAESFYVGLIQPDERSNAYGPAFCVKEIARDATGEQKARRISALGKEIH